MRVAIIGAGVAGLTCATALRRHGFEVTLFDKGRKAGGRISSRRTDEATFDHGAQYFTVDHPRFAVAIARAEAQGVVGQWTGRLGSLAPGARPRPVPQEVASRPRYVGVPTMSALARHWSEGLEVNGQQRIERVDPIDGSEDGGWSLCTVSDTFGPFDIVLVTAPAPQAVPLLTAAPALRACAEQAVMHPCWSAMIQLAEPIDFPFDAAFVEASLIRWIMRQPSKPGRGDREAWVLHATHPWSRMAIEDRPEYAAAQLVRAFEKLVGPLPTVVFCQGHRWRYALAEAPAIDRRYDPQRRIGIAGDWTHGPKVQGAFLSGRALAAEVLRAHR